jgi:hypothetical protein
MYHLLKAILPNPSPQNKRSSLTTQRTSVDTTSLWVSSVPRSRTRWDESRTITALAISPLHLFIVSCIHTLVEM